jgi:hypothetical protein
MVITDFLERNAKLYPNETALVEINPACQPDKNILGASLISLRQSPVRATGEVLPGASLI